MSPLWSLTGLLGTPMEQECPVKVELHVATIGYTCGLHWNWENRIGGTVSCPVNISCELQRHPQLADIMDTKTEGGIFGGWSHLENPESLRLI